MPPKKKVYLWGPEFPSAFDGLLQLMADDPEMNKESAEFQWFEKVPNRLRRVTWRQRLASFRITWLNFNREPRQILGLTSESQLKAAERFERYFVPFRPKLRPYKEGSMKTKAKKL